MPGVQKKTKFTDVVEKSVDDLTGSTYLGDGGTVYEVQVVRSFKVKYDADGNLILPKGVK